jgi:hypothetical protein
MKNALDVSIIIVNYKVKDKLFNCLRSIYNSNPKVSFEIIVVDNDEEKNIDKDLKKDFTKVRYIESKKNLGFGAGNNLGAKYATGDYLLFLNPDTEIVENAIDTLYDFLKQNKKVGVISPLILGEDRKPLDRQGYKELNLLNGIFTFSFLRKKFPQMTVSSYFSFGDWKSEPIKKVDTVYGAALMISHEIFNKVNGFDEQFFLYFEENDLSKRVRKLGYELYINSNSKIIHLVGQSTGQIGNSDKYFAKSRFLYFKKHFGLIQAIFLELFLKINKFTVLIFAAVILGLYLRLFNIINGMQFIGDQGWFYLSARDLLINGNIPLVGITSSHTWLHQGPLWTYLLSIFLLIFNFNPVSGAYLTTIFGIITILLIYKISSDLFSKEIGIIASFLYATSPLIILFERAPLDPSIIPLFSLIFFYALVKWVKGNIIFFPVLISFLAILYNLELATFILFFPFALIFIYGFWKKKNWILKLKDKRIIFYSFIGLLIPMAPIIIYDFSNGFKQTIVFLGWTIYKPFSFLIVGSHGNIFLIINNLFNFFALSIQKLVFAQNLYIALLIFAGSLAYLVFKLIKKQETAYLILFLLLLISFSGILISQTPSDAYLPIIFPLVIICLAIFINFMRVLDKAIVILFMLIIVFNAQSALRSDLIPDLGKRVQAVNKIIALTKGEEYNLVGAGIGSQFASFTMNYEYLLWLKGNSPSHKVQKTKIIIRETNNEIIIKKYD